ncbi:putative cytochrome P450 303a1 [Papilio xuthus]|uniref:Putative cytochrome P450 303a1 n=1 Tax=Papilio xuthus TaxID=66420 RepID=A0A194PVH1_PAPXU|nr:putative cytochrome P450 303a1 [Papilio xuthus]
MWLTILAVCIFCLFLAKSTVKPRKFPPGPKWFPIVGNAGEVNKLREKTGYLYKAVKELCNTYCKDSPLLGLKIGKDKIVMVNSLDANKEMLYNEDIDGRPKGIFYQTRTWGERKGVLLTDGELWKEQRRFLIKHLKEFGFGRKGMGDIACTEASFMLEDVTNLISKDGPQNGIFMHNFFNTYILNTLWTMMAGIRYQASDPQMIVLQELLFDLFRNVDMVGALFSHFPILAIIAPKMSGYKDFIRTHKRIWRFLREEIARHKENLDEDVDSRDFMGVYLRNLREHGERDTYSEGQLVAMCMDMFMAGTETTSKSMSFGFSYLVRNQTVQRKAQEEIDRVIGRNRLPTLDDRPNMPYNEAIVHESVRHFMGRTFGVPHRALRNTTLAGYIIPEDTMVVSNFTNILMDETLFPEPYTFQPERFIVDGKLSLPEHYFPFGLSKHRCMGDVLAKCNIFIFTTSMLQKFSFLPFPGEPLPSLDHIDGATPSAAPFKALVMPRT